MTCCSGKSQSNNCADNRFSICCSNENQTFQISDFDLSKTENVVHKLVELIRETPEFVEYARLSDLLNKDPEVRKLTRLIRLGGTYYESSNEDDQTSDIQLVKLESLPIMVEYRKAEKQVRQIFRLIDETVSGSLGLSFALNARISGCG